jgi:hypothetical protein
MNAQADSSMAAAPQPSAAEDARIAQVMEEYLSALEAGERPRPEAFLAGDGSQAARRESGGAHVL